MNHLRVNLVAVLLIAFVPATNLRAAAKTWSITVCGPLSDSRRLAIAEAVDFWNEELASLKAQLSLGPIKDCEVMISDDLTNRITESGAGSVRMPKEFDKISGDIIIFLSGADIVSTGIPRAFGRQGVVILRPGDGPPLSMPNVARNVAAHELGHVLGLVHTSDPTTLMCGRPAPCRPTEFRSMTKRFFPLTEKETKELANRFK